MNKTINSGWVQYCWIHIRTSLWFVPVTIVLFAIGLALGLMELDQRYGKELSETYPRIFAHASEGAGTMLGTIAGSMATIVGVVFSIVIVALVLASTQYTSRVLRTFMSDRITQFMLGTLTGIYTYSLLVLRSINSDQDSLVPALSVLGGFILALAGIALFIMFIHHIASSIQASSIISEITKETIQSIEETYPLQASEKNTKTRVKESAGFSWYPVFANKIGYIQSAKPEALVQLAVEHDMIIRMECCVGSFVDEKTELVHLYSAKPLTEGMTSKLQEVFAIDSFRTVAQDPSFGVRQLVDIALKALSPGINDTTTAVTCIEHLAAILGHGINRCIPAPDYYHDQQLKLINYGPDFDSMVELAFFQILETAKGNSQIYIELLEALLRISKASESDDRTQVLGRQLNVILEEVSLHVKNKNALTRISESASLLSKTISQ